MSGIRIALKIKKRRFNDELQITSKIIHSLIYNGILCWHFG